MIKGVFRFTLIVALCATTAFAQRGGGARGSGGRSVGSFGHGGFSSGGFRGGAGAFGFGRGSHFGAQRSGGGFGYGRYRGFCGYYGWYPGFSLGWGLGYGYGAGYDPYYSASSYYGSSYYNAPWYGYALPTVVISGSGFYGYNGTTGTDNRDAEYPAPARSYTREESSPRSENTDYKPTLFLIALKDHNVRPALTYWVENGAVHYVSVDHEMKQVPLSSIDRELSERLNREHHLSFRLPAGQ